MKITISGKQMTVRNSLKDAVNRKLARFDKFFGDQTEALVTCRARKGVKIMELTVTYGGTVFRAEEESDTFLTALDRAVEHLERQIRKNKTRLEKTVKSGAFAIHDIDDDDEFDEEGAFIIREKTYPTRPMTAEEAILQMNLLGHSFFVFYNDDVDGVCVVYKKKDGNYGMLMPER